MFEALFLQHPRVHIILKMVVIERDSQTIHSYRSKELCIILREKVSKPLIKEILVLLLSENLKHRRSVLIFMARVAGDEVFHTVVIEYQQLILALN